MSVLYKKIMKQRLLSRTFDRALSTCTLCAFYLLLCLPFNAFSNEKISFSEKIQPILQRSCIGCHNARSPKGDLDLTSHEALMRGGSQGALFTAGKVDKSLLIDYISGPEPKMPLGGKPLTPEEIERIQQWILQGALPDAIQPQTDDRTMTQVYHAPPVLSAIAFSPDGSKLAVSGYREILIHKADGAGLLARLPGRSDKIESIVFSPEGNYLAAVGGSPAQFGEVQFWNVENYTPIRSFKMTYDTLFAASFSPDGQKVAFGCSDKTARIVQFPLGTELVKFENHDDWIFGTAFTQDGKHLVTAGRDKALKLLEVSSGSFIDDLNSSNKGYGPIRSIHRHPSQDRVIISGDDGEPRLYRIFRVQRRDMGNTDFNLIRTYERVPGGINVLRFSPDGSLFAAGGIEGKVFIYETESGKKLNEISGDAVSVFSLAFRPDGSQLAIGGFEGTVRFFDPKTGEMESEFVPVPLQTEVSLAQ